MDILALGKTIQRLRKSAGFSQKALADQSGVSLSIIHDLEKGIGNPTAKNLGALADTIGVSPAAFWANPKAAPIRDVSFVAAFLSQFASLPAPFQNVILAIAYKDESYLTGSPNEPPPSAPMRRVLTLLKDL